jgi:septum formation protein
VAATGAERTRVVETVVAFKQLTAAEIDAYVASGEGLGKAGGYAIQGRAEALIRFISGSHSGVVGLPLFETRALLLASGFSLG